MNSSTITLRFSIDPNNFKPVDITPVKSDTGFIYFLEQNTDKIPCPFCNSIGPAEGANNLISNILDAAFGFQDFERFTKKALLLLRK